MRESRGLYDLFRLRDPAHEPATALRTAAGQRCSYADLHQAAGRIANLLQANGLCRGEVLAAAVDKSPAALTLYLACLRAGVVYLPLNTAYGETELAPLLEDTAPRALVCDPRLSAVFERHAAAGPDRLLWTLDAAGRGSLDAAESHTVDFDDPALAEDELAALLFTSGTTGRPKGAMITHGNLRHMAGALTRQWAFSEEDVLLHALPMMHGHGLFVALGCVLASGASMLFLPRFDADEVCRLLPEATVMMGVPTFYARLLKHPGFTRDAGAGMRLFTSGSAPLPVEVARGMRERTGRDLVERYGTTETAICTAETLDGEKQPGRVGRPLSGVALRVVDDAHQPLPAGRTGAVEVAGENVFQGYWREPEKTAAAFTDDGYFKTGDLGYLDGDGRLTLVGRESDLIISGGYNVYPREVENVLDRLEAVEESAVFGVPHPDFGEAVVALVVPARVDAGEEKLIAAVRRQLAGYKTPKRILFADALPRNRFGKVQKNVLRDRHQSLFRQAAAHDARVPDEEKSDE
ncbi:MAG: AMP-binding protein [Gammaproteobacteria bacterium]|nr:AMP-binding protein [Gammaproteobacteria bacterium]